jgi:hypothetical protein
LVRTRSWVRIPSAALFMDDFDFVVIMFVF